MSTNSVCKAKDPANCRYHGTSSKAPSDANLYVVYEAKKKAEEQRNKEVKANNDFLNAEKFRNVKKMPALFVIDRAAHEATTEINEVAAWIFNEESRATIKRDGTNITVTKDGTIYARRSVKKGKTAPDNFILTRVILLDWNLCLSRGFLKCSRKQRMAWS